MVTLWFRLLSPLDMVTLVQAPPTVGFGDTVSGSGSSHCWFPCNIGRPTCYGQHSEDLVIYLFSLPFSLDERITTNLAAVDAYCSSLSHIIRDYNIE